MRIRQWIMVLLLLLPAALGQRLPSVGGDDDSWGTVLNEYLLAQHRGDGKHSNVTAESFLVNNTNQSFFYITYNGSVGFNTTELYHLLNVRGTANITGTIYVGGCVGCAAGASAYPLSGPWLFNTSTAGFFNDTYANVTYDIRWANRTGTEGNFSAIFSRQSADNTTLFNLIMAAKTTTLPIGNITGDYGTTLSNRITLLPANISGDFSVWTNEFTLAQENVTSLTAALSLINGSAQTALSNNATLVAFINSVKPATLPAANISGTFANASLTSLDASKLLNIAFLDNNILLTAANVTGDLSSWNNKITLSSSNITGTINAQQLGGQVSSFFYNTSQALQPLLNGISVIGANVTGDLSSFNSKITLLAPNITGDLSSWNNKIRLDYANLTNTPTIPTATTTLPIQNITGDYGSTLSNRITLLAQNITGDLSSWNIKLTIAYANTTGIPPATTTLPIGNITGDYGSTLSNKLTLLAQNVTGDLSFWNSKITILAPNVTGDLSSWNNKLTIAYANTTGIPPATTTLPIGNITGDYGATLSNKLTILAQNVTGDLSFWNNKIILDYSNLTNTPTIPPATTTLPIQNITGDYGTTLSNKLTILAQNVTGDLSSWNTKLIIAFANTTGIPPATTTLPIANITGDYGTTLSNRITLLAQNITGDLSFWNNKTRLDYSNLTNTPTIPAATTTLPAANITEGIFSGGVYNFSSSLIVHASKCTAGQVLSTTANGTVQCITDQGAGGVTLPATNITGDLSSWNTKLTIAYANTTGIPPATTTLPIVNITGDYGTTLNNRITLLAQNITGDLSFWNNKITLLAQNVTGDLSSWNNKLTIAFANTTGVQPLINGITIPFANITGSVSNVPSLPAANITSGTFGSGGYTFPENLIVTRNLTASNNLLFVSNLTSSVGIGTVSPLFTLQLIGNANLSGEVILHNTKCSAGQVLSTTANGTVQCVAPGGNPANFFNAPWLYNTSGQGFFNDTYANATWDVRWLGRSNGESNFTTIFTRQSADNTTLVALINAVKPTSLPLGNISGFNGVTLPPANVTGDFSVWTNEFTLDAANTTSGIFASARMPNLGWTFTATALYNNTAGVNVGIGTNLPNASLHVTGSPDVLALNINSTLYVNTTTSSVGIGNASPARTLHISDTLRIQPRSAAPSSAALGDIYVDSDSGELCLYNGTAWFGVAYNGTCA